MTIPDLSIDVPQIPHLLQYNLIGPLLALLGLAPELEW